MDTVDEQDENTVSHLTAALCHCVCVSLTGARIQGKMVFSLL